MNIAFPFAPKNYNRHEGDEVCVFLLCDFGTFVDSSDCTFEYSLGSETIKNWSDIKTIYFMWQGLINTVMVTADGTFKDYPYILSGVGTIDAPPQFGGWGQTIHPFYATEDAKLVIKGIKNQGQLFICLTSLEIKSHRDFNIALSAQGLGVVFPNIDPFAPLGGTEIDVDGTFAGIGLSVDGTFAGNQISVDGVPIG